MNEDRKLDPEARRLEVDARREKNWKRWGSYLSERQWATVREDRSADGDRGEDGPLGSTDRQCRLCFALALCNEKDPATHFDTGVPAAGLPQG